ncbi:MAG: Rubrerythrin [Epulopiscium sp. Nuni2H_MBin003]|nr:MAG: Rubrerythrin [Epulopiscium sp. Nuni2H_MBin003]
MQLNDKEKQALKDLQSQEKLCKEKYDKYAQQAHDPVLTNLFNELATEEQQHYDSLNQVLTQGTVPQVNCNDSKGKNYNPTATYSQGDNSAFKTEDSFLATDCIATEKLVSGEYNDDVFVFGDSDVRKLFADIQVEEQNHAEMLYKYKVSNGMAN